MHIIRSSLLFFADDFILTQAQSSNAGDKAEDGTKKKLDGKSSLHYSIAYCF